MPDVNSAPSLVMSMRLLGGLHGTHLHFSASLWPRPNSQSVPLDARPSLAVDMSHARATLILRESPSCRKELTKKLDSFMDDLKADVSGVMFKLCTVRPTVYLHEKGNVSRWDKVHRYAVAWLFSALRKYGLGCPLIKLDFPPQVQELVASFLILPRRDYETLSEPVELEHSIHYVDERGNPISVSLLSPSASQVTLDKILFSCKAANGALWKKNTNYRLEVSVCGQCNEQLFFPTTSFPYRDPYESSYDSSQGFKGLCRTIDFYTGGMDGMGVEPDVFKYGWSRQLGLDVAF